MELNSNAWIDRGSDHLMTAFREDSDAVLARNAEAIELGCMDGLPDDVFGAVAHQTLKGSGDNPGMTVRLLHASYEAAFSDDPRLPAGGKFPKSRSPVKASLEWTALLKPVGVNTLVQAPTIRRRPEMVMGPLLRLSTYSI